MYYLKRNYNARYSTWQAYPFITRSRLCSGKKRRLLYNFHSPLVEYSGIISGNRRMKRARLWEKFCMCFVLSISPLAQPFLCPRQYAKRGEYLPKHINSRHDCHILTCANMLELSFVTSGLPLHNTHRSLKFLAWHTGARLVQAQPLICFNDITLHHQPLYLSKILC